MYEAPICTGGWLDVLLDGGTKRIGLTRIHMEEDTGKNIHDAHGDASLVDFNRSSVPLLEIVSEPDMRTVAEAGAYLRMLRSILMYLEICDGNMEEGSFRCDANVSCDRWASRLRHEGRDQEHEFLPRGREGDHLRDRAPDRRARRRRADRPETRLWDADREETRSMRKKEYADDYRYFPEPDLLPLVVEPAWVADVARPCRSCRAPVAIGSRGTTASRRTTPTC